MRSARPRLARPEEGDALETPLQALNDSARLRLNEGACLPLRSDFGGCRACASVCPARVLDVQPEQLVLAEGCLSCGRCIAACPTEALHLDGFDVPATLPEGFPMVEVECSKVPAAERSVASVQVPCLGVLSPGRLAQLHEAAGPRGVALIDRGWCSRCSAGCAEVHPVAAALERIGLWLEATHDPLPAPHLVSRPLPQDSMPQRIPQPAAPVDEGPALSRRQFFRSLAEDPVGRRRSGTPIGGPGRAAFPASQRRESPERQRLFAALDRAAARGGTTIPPEFFPRVTSNQACADHRVCTAACPTGSLKAIATDRMVSLTFASTSCIGCGACTRSCPEGALSLDYHGGERTPTVLVRHEQQVCRGCGELFAPSEGETLCLTCAKSQRFIGDAMSQLYGARN